MNSQVFAEALSTISQGVLISDEQGLILYMNPAFTQITGYGPEDLFGQSCRRLQGKETNPETIAAIRRAIRSQKAFHGEILNYRKSGQPFWNDLTITPLCDDRGQLRNFIGITRDVTAEKEARKHLVAMERHFRFLFQHVQAGIVLHAADTRILEINDLAATLLGVSAAEALGAVNTDPRWAFVDEENALIPIENYPVNRAVATKSIIRNLVLGNQRVSDGKLVWLLCTAFPLFDVHGAVDRVLVTFTDVTELKQTERALHKSEERLQLILRGANDAAWDWEIRSNEFYYSPRWWQMLGYEPEEIPADAQLWIRLLHPRDRAQSTAILEQSIREGRNTYSMEYRLRHKDGHYVPVLSRGFILRDPQGNPIRISGANTDQTEQKRVEKKIHKLAYYDYLTGLPNRQMLNYLLRKAIRASKRFKRQGAVLFIDLDDFKTLNDTLGHDVGDLLLKQVARRLRRCVRKTDTVARVGGDEFVIILEDLSGDGTDAAVQAQTVAVKLRESMSLPYTLGKTSYRSTVSIGIAPFEQVRRNVSSVLKQADLAMYDAKAVGRNTIRFFDGAMQSTAEQRLELELSLRSGIHDRQMEVYLQPQVDQGCSITGAEALLRWNHPAKGLLYPDAFIPLAEATGLILPLGEWVLHAVCCTLAAWSSHPRRSQFTVSVNLSLRQLHDPNFVAGVLDILSRTGANPSRLKLEITESILASDVHAIVEKMNLLRAHGVTFSLDDFGTGYSSLSYLQRMPIDELKIDRAFVRDVLVNPNDATITRIIISLAQNLGMSVIAEGVETEQQYRFLEEHGCARFQGYLFGKPMRQMEFEALVPSAPGLHLR